MECSKKNRSSYQTLKEDYLALKEEYREKQWIIQRYYTALVRIARLRGPELTKAPDIAINAIAYEEE